MSDSRPATQHSRAVLPLAINLGIAAALRLVLPFTLAAGGERHLYYLMSVLLPVRGCPTYQCFRLVPPLVTTPFPLHGSNAFLAAGLVFQGFPAAVARVLSGLVARTTR